MAKAIAHALIGYLVGAYACIATYALVLGHYGPSQGGYAFFLPYLDLVLIGPAIPPMFTYELIARHSQLPPGISRDTALSLGMFLLVAVIAFAILRHREAKE